MSEALLKALSTGERKLPLPDVLMVDGEPLNCKHSLRLLPGKRLTASGTWRGQAVVVKLFLPHAVKDMEAELAGHKALSAARIATPELLWNGQLENGCTCVLYRFLDEAAPLSEALQTDRRGEFLARSLILLARMHRAGLWQSDPHLDNFLVVGGELLVVDNGSVRSESAPLQREGAYDNLACFIAQFTWREHDEVLSSLASYAPDVDRAGVAKRVEVQWWERTRRYLKKVFRDCTEVAVQHARRYFLAYKRHLPEEWVDRFRADPDGLMAAGELLKDGNSATVVRAEIDGEPVVIKRYNLKNPLHALRRCLRKTRAWNAWRAAHLLGMTGVATPAPLLLLEKRFGLLRGTAYLVTEDVGGAEMLDEYGQRAPSQGELAQLAAIFQVMNALHVCHGDFKAKNFLVTDAGIQLLDLDVLHEQQNTVRFQRCAENDRERFLRNWSDQPDLQAEFQKLIDKAMRAA